MSFNDAVGSVFANYADFKGRASRAEFWYWVLFLLLSLAVFDVLSFELSWLFRILYVIFAVFIVVPTLSISVRRMRDSGGLGFLHLLLIVLQVGVVYWLLDTLPALG